MKKRIYLSIIRKKSDLCLAFVFSCIFIFSFISIAVYKAADKGISEIEKTYGSSFHLVQMRDENNPDMWEERDFGGGFSLQVYVGPQVSKDMAEMVAEIEGIEYWEPYLETRVRPYKYNLLPGYYANSREYFLNDPKYVWTEEDEVANQSVRFITYEYPVRDSTYYPEFLNGSFVLKEGRHIQPADEYTAIVSQAFAELNHLKVGDTLVIDTDSLSVRAEYPAVSLGAVEVKIIGLFAMTYQQIITDYTEEMDIMENWLIVDMQTGMDTKEIYGEEGDQWSSALFYVDNPSRIEEVMERVRDCNEIDWRYFYLKKDDTLYSEAIVPLNTMRIMMAVILLIIIVTGLVLVVLFISHAVKRRKRESGILMALGIPVKEIRKQIVLEYLIIGLAAFVLAIGISGYAAPTAGNQLLNMLAGNGEQKAYTQEEIEAAIAEGDMQKAAEMAQLQPSTVSTPDTLDIQIEIWQILAVGTAVLAAIAYSVNRIVQKTLRLSPRKVLSMIE